MKHIKIFSLTSEYETSKSGGTLITPNVSLINETNSVRYLPELDDPYNGHEYVDLGLPSGTKWATCNVGAKRPEDPGLLFAWGGTTGHNIDDIDNFNEDNYDGPSDELILQNINNDYIIPAGYDAATVNMGGKWRIPTKADFEELITNCNVEETGNYGETDDFYGYRGTIFTSKHNGNSMFIPTDSDSLFGEYWTSSGFYDENEINIQIYEYDNDWPGGSAIGQFVKYFGHLIRPVCE